jgi:2-polyprenyl-6-hydroxyphenyl methylase/3-demethylubiquinone-9 3-methyltransferase
METEVINNTFYEELGQDWYNASNHPIALLRSENRARAPFVQKKIEAYFGKKKCRILDVGCGAGFLSNELAKSGHEVTGIDLSEGSLEVARRKDVTKSVHYLQADGLELPFEPNQFDIVLAMDFLEHIEEPKRAILSAANVLKSGGLFFFHTFNRTFLSWLVIIKGVEWFVKNAPKNMHVHQLFIKPSELDVIFQAGGLVTKEIHGLSPKVNGAFWKMLATRRVDESFAFKFTKNLSCGYVGFAQKN